MPQLRHLATITSDNTKLPVPQQSHMVWERAKDYCVDHEAPTEIRGESYYVMDIPLPEIIKEAFPLLAQNRHGRILSYLAEYANAINAGTGEYRDGVKIHKWLIRHTYNERKDAVLSSDIFREPVLPHGEPVRTTLTAVESPTPVTPVNRIISNKEVCPHAGCNAMIQRSGPGRSSHLRAHELRDLRAGVTPTTPAATPMSSPVRPSLPTEVDMADIDTALEMLRESIKDQLVKSLSSKADEKIIAIRNILHTESMFAALEKIADIIK
jgi:hypothetical protein